MRFDVLIALSIGSALALAGTALGQQPTPSTAPPAGPPADYGVPITNEQAKAVAAAAFAEARKNNSPMAVAIVGPAGERQRRADAEHGEDIKSHIPAPAGPSRRHDVVENSSSLDHAPVGHNPGQFQASPRST